jgi:hypothetical protein
MIGTDEAHYCPFYRNYFLFRSITLIDNLARFCTFSCPVSTITFRFANTEGLNPRFSIATFFLSSHYSSQFMIAETYNSGVVLKDQ